jgi:hypothetical protein
MTNGPQDTPQANKRQDPFRPYISLNFDKCKYCHKAFRCGHKDIGDTAGYMENDKRRLTGYAYGV